MSALFTDFHASLWSLAADDSHVRRDIALNSSTNGITLQSWVSQQIAMNGSERILDLSTGAHEQADAVMPYLSAGEVCRYDTTRVEADSGLPYADAVFDVVSADHTLFARADNVAIAAEFRRVLRPNGVVVLTTHARDHLQELTDLHIIAASSAGLPGEALHAARAAHAAIFRFDDGGRILAPYFDDVCLRTQADTLEFASAAPVIRYYQTTTRYAEIMHDATIAPEVKAAIPERMRAIVGALIADADDGLFCITSKRGVFIARRATA